MNGRHEQAASDRALERQAAETSQCRSPSCASTMILLHGNADMTGIDRLLATDINPVWRDELLARRHPSTPLFGVLAP